MKFLAVILLALVAAINAAPINVSDNNIGDIITVGIKGSIDIQNEVNQDIINVIIAMVNQQLGVIVAPGSAAEEEYASQHNRLTPEMIEKFRALLSKQ